MTLQQPIIRHRSRPAPKVLDAHPGEPVRDAQEIARPTRLEPSLSSLQAPRDQHRGFEDIGLSKTQVSSIREDDVSREDYEVGYGRPPKWSQFRKGERRNPKGRPKHSKNALTILKDELFKEVTVIEGGRKRKMTKMQIGARKLANSFAEKSDPKTALNIIKLFVALAGPSTDSDPSSTERASKPYQRDEELLAWFVSMQAEQLAASAANCLQDQDGRSESTADPLASSSFLAEGGDDD